jgi:CSLREA domain-containing protein
MNLMIPASLLCRTASFMFMLTALSAQAATITVNSLADTALDDGSCTLREAITAVNTNSASGGTAGECTAGTSSDLIEFDIAGSIQLTGQLPLITSPVHINGYSATGASKNTLPLSQGTNANLVVAIDVNGGNYPILYLSGAGAAGSIVEGLVLNNNAAAPCCFQIGIYASEVSGAATTYIRGNFVSTNSSGTARAALGSRGIAIWESSANFVIGSDIAGNIDPGAVNLIAGANGQNISLDEASNIRVRGNLVGTNAAGNASILSFQAGLAIDQAENIWASDNVISGHNGSGLSIRQTSSNIHIERNLIGVQASGTGALPNLFSGILISENPNITGGFILNVDLVENVVANNTCNNCSGGIVIGEANSANTIMGIRLTRNRVFSNAGLNIDLGLTNANNNGLIYGVTDNDIGDPDDGANTLQNFPVITSAVGIGSNIVADYTFNSDASKDFTLEFFHTSSCHASGHGGGELYLGKAEISTDGSGDHSGQVLLPSNKTDGFVTATATNTENGTSEFSACMALVNDMLFEDGFEAIP